MAKYILEDDDSVIQLYGIASHSKPYQLVFAINQHDDLSFVHCQKAMNIEYLPKIVHDHPYFVLNDEWLEHQLYLIVNYQNGRYLAPKLKHAHYLLLSESENHFRIKEIISKIKTSKGVLTVFELNNIDKKIQDEIRLWVT